MSVSESSLIAERYRIIELLGHGGMGRVWRARDELLHRDVAIKEILPPEGLTPDERAEARKRTLREARATARLNHPNVVRVFDIVQTEDFPWIVMEYVPSRSLDEIIKGDGPISPERAAHIGLGVLAALRAAHSVGVLHRDVKPSNVLLTDDDRVVLTDFGLATLPDDATLTRPGVVLGSPAYIAPERARDGSSGPEADLWSLGATLYAAVEGQSPYARSSAMATLIALATEDYPPPQRAGELRPVITGLLRKDPAARLSDQETERLLTRATGNGRSGTRTAGGMVGGLAAKLRRTAPAQRRDADSPATGVPTSGGAGSGTGSSPDGRIAADADGAAAVAAAAGLAAAGRADAADPAGKTAVVPPTGDREPSDPWVGESPTSVLDRPDPGGVAPTAVQPGPSATRVQPAGPAAPVSPPPMRGSAHPVPAGQTYPGEPRRRTPLVVGALALLFIVALVAFVALRNPGSDNKHDAKGPAASSGAPAQSSAPAGGGQSAPPSQAPTSAPATSAPAPAPTATGGASLPEGWKRYEDSSGFKVGVPNGFNLDKRQTTETGVRVYLRDGNGRLLLIESTDQPKSDPVADWQNQEKNRRGTYSNYQLIGIHAVQTQFPSSADWEFTYDGNSGTRLHVINRAVITVPGKQAYGIYWSVPQDQWDASVPDLATITRTFQPAPV